MATTMTQKATNDNVEAISATHKQPNPISFTTMSSTVPHAHAPITHIVGIATPLSMVQREPTVTARQEHNDGCLQSKMAMVRNLTAKIAWQRAKRHAADLKPGPSIKEAPVTTRDNQARTRIASTTNTTSTTNNNTVSRFIAQEEPNLSPMPDDERLHQHILSQRGAAPPTKPLDPVEHLMHRIHDLEMLLQMEQEDGNHDATHTIQGRIRSLRRQLDRQADNTSPSNSTPVVTWKDAPSDKREKFAKELKLLRQILDDNRTKYDNLLQENRRLKDDVGILQNLVQRHNVVSPSIRNEPMFQPELEAALENLAQVKTRNKELEEDLARATEELTMFREQFYEHAKATMVQTERTKTHRILSPDEWTKPPKVKQGTIQNPYTEYAVEKEERTTVVPNKVTGKDKLVSLGESKAKQNIVLERQATKHGESSESSAITLKTGNAQVASERIGLNHSQQYSQ